MLGPRDVPACHRIPAGVPWLTVTRFGAGRTLLVAFAAWTLVGVVSFGRAALTGPARALAPWPDLAVWLACFYGWALLTPPVVGLTRRFPFEPGRLSKAAFAHLGGSLAFAELAALLSAGSTSLVLRLAGRPAEPLVWPVLSPRALLVELLAYSAIAAATSVLLLYERYRKQEADAAELARQRAELEASLKRAQLDLLRAQMSPHFLFNTLQSISVLMHEDVAAADAMLVRLSDLLRTGLLRDLPQEIPLDEELRLTEGYLDIERIRFADRLDVRLDIQPETRRALLPSLLLQPLAENAVRHGVAHAAGPVTLQIRSRAVGEELEITVLDTGPAAPAEGGPAREPGVGLANSKERVERLYPGCGRMQWGNGRSGGFEVSLRIPFHEAGARSGAPPA